MSYALHTYKTNKEGRNERPSSKNKLFRANYYYL